MSSAPPAGPLSGLVVAHFSRVLAGPYATMPPADPGAEVIEVEGPGGDDTRSRVPVRDDVATYCLAINRNKRSIAPDLKDPGGLARFGLGHEAVRARNEAVVSCSISGFGTGAGANLRLRPASPGGVRTDELDRHPGRAAVPRRHLRPRRDDRSALGHRHPLRAAPSRPHRRGPARGGQPAVLRPVSSALSSPVDQTSAYVAGGAVPTGMGNARPSPFPYEPLRTGDGELIVVVGDDGRFRRLADLPGTRRSVPARRTRSLTVDGAEC